MPGVHVRPVLFASAKYNDVMRTRALGALLICSSAAFGSPNLDKARQLVNDLKFADAGKALQAAEAQDANPRAELIEIYELEGIVFGSVNKPELSRTAFMKLLTLDPEHKLSGKFAPRVTTPFYEAKGKVHETGALSLTLGMSVVGDKLAGLGLTLKDPAQLAKKIVVHTSEDGRPWKVTNADAKPETLVSVSAKQLYWFADVLGEHDAVLFSAFSAGAPGLQTVPQLDVPPAAPPEPPALEPPRVDAAQSAAPPVHIVKVRKPRLRGLAWALGIVAIIPSFIAFVCQGSVNKDRVSNPAAANTLQGVAIAGYVVWGIFGIGSALAWTLGTIYDTEVEVEVPN
jgi:hypothetical protein